MEPSASARVLVVDDEPIVRDVLSRYLVREGFEVETVGDGREALDAVERFRPDLVLLDLMLPAIDGLEVFRRLGDRGGSSSAVIMLTAKGEEIDRVVGLELGADDYVVKPFSPREVVAKVGAILKRANGAAVAKPVAAPLSHGRLRLDADGWQAQWAQEPVMLTATEFQLLRVL